MRCIHQVASLALLGLFVVACGRRDGDGPVSDSSSGRSLRGALTVFAASSLTDAFNEIAAQFQKDNPSVTVTFNFGASSTLRTQLEQGARADIFASADQVQMDAARGSGVVAGDDRIFAKNKLVLIYPAGNPARIASVRDLARPGIKLVLAQPNVPIGAYARQALQMMAADPQFGTDFAQKALANLRSEEANVRAVVTKVQLGEADAAIVYTTDVTPSVAKDVQSIPLPDQFNVIATYPIAMVKGAPNPAAAAAFIAFLRSPGGQAILRQNGFIVDRDTGSSRTVPLSGAELRTITL